MKKIILALSFICLLASAMAQEKISGKIVDENREPIIGAYIQLLNTNYATISNQDGYFEFKIKKYSIYTLKVQSIGYEEQFIQIDSTNNELNSNLKIVLKQSSEAIDDVYVIGKSENQIKREEPIKVDVIDVAEVLQQSTNLPELLNQTSGVKVRQSSGVGSATSININGLQGNAIRYFKDGIPVQYLGRAFNIGLVPTGSIQNIEIYKGVLPISLGADALGGAINIVSKSKDQNYLDVSYEMGSFNTNIVNLNGNFALPNTKFHIGLSSYYVHSDNNYDFDIDITDFNGYVKKHRVNRFHDAITTKFIEANFGVHQVKWADLLNLKVAYFDFNNQVQNGVSIEQALGGVTEYEDNKIISLQYIKTIKDRLTVNAFGAYGDRYAKDKDLSKYLYDWSGKKGKETTGGEVTKKDQKTNGDTKVGRLTLNYDVSKRINVKASTTYNSREVVGEDPFAQVNLVTGIQPITIPSTYSKMISGLGLGTSFLNEKLKGESFVKHYQLNTESPFLWGNKRTEKLDYSSFGWGQSFKYAFNDNTYTRLSYEKATRIPESEEYFGDNLFLLPNPSLKPEKSDNINIGFASSLNKSKSIFFETNLFYRDTNDFIREFPLGLINSINRNSDTQITKGIETVFMLQPTNSTSINLSATYQDLRRKETTGTNRGLEDSRTPNTPYLFSNISAKHNLKKPFQLPINVSVYGNHLFTEQYFVKSVAKVLEPPIFGTSPSAISAIIPTQHQVNMGSTVSLEKIPLNLNFEVINLLNDELYDDFRIPKAYRNFRFKATYKLK